jgi:hypothetical protein
MRVICLRIGQVREDDDPSMDPTGRARAIWISFRDTVQIVQRSLAADVRFGIYYGVSGNARRFWDISNAERELGYQPQDDAERFYND